MDFDEDDHLTSIRHAIREICADFDDGYWRDHDSRHEFPWEFYEALAKGGWVGVAIPGEYGGGGGGVTEASVVVEEVAASGAAMNGASAKYLASEAAFFASGRAVQTHGGPRTPASTTWAATSWSRG
jgi:acyl-CoA dehydrogenase